MWYKKGTLKRPLICLSDLTQPRFVTTYCDYLEKVWYLKHLIGFAFWMVEGPDQCMRQWIAKKTQKPTSLQMFLFAIRVKYYSLRYIFSTSQFSTMHLEVREWEITSESNQFLSLSKLSSITFITDKKCNR